MAVSGKVVRQEGEEHEVPPSQPPVSGTEYDEELPRIGIFHISIIISSRWEFLLDIIWLIKRKKYCLLACKYCRRVNDCNLDVLHSEMLLNQYASQNY